ncbi:Band 7 protein domain containing protein [Aphelenchoides besseyi]|nr:Band 7 protein domain containing protein [Aphelenchoides besseyi]
MTEGHNTPVRHDVERADEHHRQKSPNLRFEQTEPYDACSWFLIVISYLLVFITFPFTFFLYFRIVQQYERAVIFRLGRLKAGGAKGPGLFFILPCIDEYRKVDLRVVSFSIPPQELLSRDSVTVEVDAVVYFRIYDATISIVNVENATGSTKLLAQTTLRTVLGTKSLSEMLSHREEISAAMQTVLDQATEAWGVKVSRVEVKDIRLPKQMQRSLAAEAEASREAKAKIIAAEGERQASEALRSAAEVMGSHPAALQLRYLQTLNTIASERNSTYESKNTTAHYRMDIISSFLPEQRPQPQSYGNVHPAPAFTQHQHPQQIEEGNSASPNDFHLRSVQSTHSTRS